jgi:hypothetical protein
MLLSKSQNSFYLILINILRNFNYLNYGVKIYFLKLKSPPLLIYEFFFNKGLKFSSTWFLKKRKKLKALKIKFCKNLKDLNIGEKMHFLLAKLHFP